MADDVSVNRESNNNKNGGLVQKLDAAGWGLFFIWVGIALLMEFSWGVGLIGVSVITLGGQAARKFFGLALQGFWIVCGLFFLAGGIWELYKVEVSLVPILLIVAGGALLVSLALGTRRGAE